MLKGKEVKTAACTETVRPQIVWFNGGFAMLTGAFYEQRAKPHYVYIPCYWARP
jgi:NAD-dependent SIR2 family protein deacetylase